MKRFLLFFVLVLALAEAGTILLFPRSKPQYCLLVFGPTRMRVWIATDGEGVRIDCNGGEFPSKGRYFAKLSDCKNIELVDPDGMTRYVITSMEVFPEGDPPCRHLNVSVDIKGSIEYQQYCDVELRNTPGRAAVAHFHGPLAVGPVTFDWQVPHSLALETGDAPTELRALVGTMNPEQSCWVVVRSQIGDKSAFPQGVCPVVQIEFPSKHAGAPPVKTQYLLDESC